MRVRACHLPILASWLWTLLLADLTRSCRSQCTVQQAQDDTCVDQFDDFCDVGGLCEAGTDCFDCDPCQAFSATSCGECLANAGCAWCPSPDPVVQYCVSIDVVSASPTFACPVLFPRPGWVTEECYETCDFTQGVGPLCDQAFNNVCQETYDPELGLDICAENTDCYDCDACREFDFSSCEQCTNAPVGDCVWCSRDGTCHNANLALSANTFVTPTRRAVWTCQAEDYAFDAAGCQPLEEDNFFSDPLYDASRWAFDMINIRPVWESGLTGAGVGIRINDNGVDPNHPEIAGRFDYNSSCSVFLPAETDGLPTPSDSHGTACATIAAGATNGFCSVGIAPGATISSCKVLGEGESSTENNNDGDFLYLNMENMDIASSSIGKIMCFSKNRNANGRRLNVEGCPFAPESPLCDPEGACATNNWENLFATEDCERDIIRYCSNSFNFETNYETCQEFLYLWIECYYPYTFPIDPDGYTIGATEGRGGKGIIYIWASGNDYGSGASVSQGGFWLSSPYAIAVAAVGKDRLHSSYSTGGPATFIAAPGGDAENLSNVISALNGDRCGNVGVGTSWAAPMVSGVVALMLEANGNLTWRDVQEILARSGTFVEDDTDSTWVTNAAGYNHSDYYGFGIIDANAAVTTARTWELLPPQLFYSFDITNVNIDIPDAGPISSSSFISLDNPGFALESIQLYVNLDHSSRGDLKISLMSPSGTVAVVHKSNRPERGATLFWEFKSLKTWGEKAEGTWTLTIQDEREGDLSECRDIRYLFAFSNLVVDCGIIEVASDFCTGQNTSFFGFPVDGPDDPILSTPDGTLPSTACCICGGGIPASDVVDRLNSWSLYLYGRDARELTDAPTSMPSSAPSRSPSEAPSERPSDTPTTSPVVVPTGLPSHTPTGVPTDMPTGIPTSQPNVDSQRTADNPSRGARRQAIFAGAIGVLFAVGQTLL